MQFRAVVASAFYSQFVFSDGPARAQYDVPGKRREAVFSSARR